MFGLLSSSRISQALSQVAKAGLGAAMLYELIEKGKEILTDNNIPHGQCVICLYDFQVSFSLGTWVLLGMGSRGLVKELGIVP